MAGRHSLLCLHCKLIYNLIDKLQFLYQFKNEQLTMRLGA